MKNNKKIVFFLDHKHRDLLSTVSISNFLKLQKFKTKIVPQWKFNIINQFDPKFIVLGKNNIHDFEKIRWKLEGRKIISIPNENFHLKNIDKIDISCDLNFYWNKNTKNQQIIKNKKIVVGNPRTDFIKKKTYKLKKKTITFALPPSKQELKNYTDLIKFSKAQQKKILKNNKSVLALDEISRGRNIVDKILNWTPLLSKKFKNIDFYLKPHPNDNIYYWLNLQKKIKKLKNLKIIYGINIFSFLNKSNLHIAAEGCTTVFESIFSGIPTAEIICNKSITKRMFFNHQLSLCLNKIKTFDDFNKLVTKISVKKKIVSTNDKLMDKYIVNNFNKVDGNRCYEYANEISKFAKEQEHNDKMSNFIKLLIELIKVKKIIYLNFFIKLCIKKLFNFNLDYPDFKHIKVNRLTKIDKTGRYDSRIKNKDIIDAEKKIRSLQFYYNNSK